MLMANAVSQLAAKTPGKESMAMESFAKALRQVRVLAKFQPPLRKQTQREQGNLLVVFLHWLQEFDQKVTEDTPPPSSEYQSWV